MKKLGIYILVIVNCILLSGCSLFNNEQKNKNISNRGLSYYFSNEEYGTVQANIDNLVTYNAPSMKCESDKYIRLYRTETEILFIWFGKNDDKVNSNSVLNKNSKILTKYISTFSSIDTVDVAFNLDMVAKDTVNNIERNKYVGTITGIDDNGIDVGLRTSIYTFVVGKRPGCIMGILTGANQEDDRFDEIETNTQVMVNSMKPN